MYFQRKGLTILEGPRIGSFHRQIWRRWERAGKESEGYEHYVFSVQRPAGIFAFGNSEVWAHKVQPQLPFSTVILIFINIVMIIQTWNL